MDAAQQATESASAVVAKVAPPLTVSFATVAGVSVSEILVWATLVYTVLMIGHKIFQIYKELKK